MDDLCTGKDAWHKPRICRSRADDDEIAAPGLAVLLIALVIAYVWHKRR